MILLIAFLIFIFGTLIGSFLNVVILRYNTGKSILGSKERSMCFSCGKELRWYELVPVFSFVFLRGKCSVCKSTISWQYPLVEIATGLMFVAIFAKDFSGFFSNTFDWTGISLWDTAFLTLLHLTIWSLLIVITVYDMRHKIIPDALVYAFAILSLAAAFFFPAASGSFLWSLVAGVAFFAFFGGLWLVSGGRWLGFGDAKLVLGVGFLLGPVSGLSALTLSFWIGAVVAIGLLTTQKFLKSKAVQQSGLRGRLFNLTMKSEIPFAPFIILGTLIAFFCHVDIFGLASLF